MYRNKNKGVKIKLGILCALFAVLVSCMAVLLCGSFNASKTAQNAPADLDEITLPEKSASSAIAGGNASDDGSISAPALEAKSTATVNSGTTASAMVTAWSSAVSQSSTYDTVTFVLQANWTASTNATYGTSFGTGTGFDNGRLCVPSGKSVAIDLNGYTLDRGLSTSAARANGGVIYVSGGDLTICDNSADQSGRITGGKTTSDGGGIDASSGYVYIESGNIVGNYAHNGGGVSGQNVYMNGGNVSKNECDWNGGGISAYNFNMRGGNLTGNISGLEGAGVDVGTSLSISGGTISNNTAGGYGGAVSISGSTSTISGGQIVHNSTIGVYLFTGGCELTFSGGEISGNTGYGVYNNESTFIMTGGNIYNNQGGIFAYQNCAGGSNTHPNAIQLSGGNIYDNKGGYGGVYTMYGASELNGPVQIYGNQNSSEEDCNLLFDRWSEKFKITGSLVGANIGIYDDKIGAIFTSGYSTYNSSYDPSIFFKSDKSGYKITKSGNDLMSSSGSSSAASYIYWRYGTNLTTTGSYNASSGSSIIIAYTGQTFLVGAYTSSGSGTALTIASKSYKNANGTTISNTTAIKNVGTYSFVVNSTSYKNASFTLKIVPADMSDVTVEVPSVTYTGGALDPTPTVKLGNTTLSYNTDYTVSYSNNTNVGNAKITLTGKGNFTGVIAKNFTIDPKDISTATVTLSWTSDTYSGSPRTPGVTVKEGSASVSSSNYTVKYSNNVNVGTGYAVVVGQGNYTGTVTREFTISPMTLTTTYTTVTLSNSNYTYDGTPKTPSVSTIKYAGSTITPTYTVAYSDNINAGTATVSVTFNGNYAGTIDQTFTISKVSVASANIDFGSITYVYTGSEISPIPTVTVGDKILTPEVDFTVSYGLNVNAGDCSVLIRGTGNYESSKPSSFTIEQRQIFVAGIKVADKEYDGTTSATVDTSGVKLIGAVEADKANLGLSFTAGTEFDGAAVGLHSVAITGVELTGTAAGNYILEADEVTGYAQIYPATVTVSGVVANGKTYDGTTAVTFDITGATFTGVIASELADIKANLTAEGHFNNKNAGDGVAVSVISYILGGDYAGNYYIDFANSETSLTADITPAQVEVTLGKTEYKVTYGNALKITYSQNSPVKSESVTLALKYFDAAGNIELSGVPTDAGTYLVKVTVDPNDENLANYLVKNTGEGIISQATVIIEKATLTVTVEDLEIEYGAAVPADDDYTLIYNGWLNGDKAAFEDGDITFIQNIVISTDYTAGNDADGYDVTLSGGELKNYELTFVGGTLWVVPKQVTVKIHNKTGVYGEDDVELTSNGAADIGITLEREEGTAVGKYVISGDWDNDNYDVTFINGVYEITKATLTVTANANTITYGDVASNNGVEYGAFAYDEDDTVLKGTLAYRYTYTQYGNVYEDGTDEEIAYYIIPYGLTADNYEIIFVNGLLTVNQKAATVTVSNVSGDITNTPADRAEAAKKVKYAVDGTVNGDDLIVQINIASTGVLKEGNVTQGVNWFAVGSYDITATFNNPNYIVSFAYENGATKGTYTISKGTLILTANTLIITYGDAVAFPADLDEALSAEGLPSGSTLADLFGTAISGTLSVLPYGDAAYAEYAAMGSAYQLGDDIFDASGNRISYVVIPTGLASSSYTIIFKPGKLLVEPKSIVVNLDDKSGVYGEELKELTASATGLVGYDDSVSVAEFLGITGLAKASGTDAGNYAITATGSTNANYRVTFVNGVYTIEQYEVTLVWVSGNEDETDFNYVYDAKEHAPVATFEMHGTTYSSTDDEATRLIEIMGSGVNAGDYRAQAFLLNNNLKFSTAQDNELTKSFTVKAKQLTVKWYKDSGDIGNAEKVLDTSDVVTYNYRVGDPWAPVAVVEGVADADKSIVSIEVSGKQNSVNKGNPYVAELWIHGSNNYSVANSDKTIEFVIVMVAPGDFKWEGETSYVYNGEAQQPVATASNNAYFIYVVELLDEDGEAVKTVPTAISVGKYRITAEPKDVNFLIPADKNSYEFEITPFVATVVWSATSFEYNGAKQVPTAYYSDVYGQHVELEVTLADGENGTDGGNDYHVSVTLNTANYTFKDGDDFVTTLEKTYTITQKNIVVVWESKYNGTDDKWVAEYKNADESESVSFVATMNNEAEPLALDVKVYWQAKSGDEPVEVNKVQDAGIYTWRVALSNRNGAVNGNYAVVNAEQTFEITRPKLTVKAANQTVNTGAAVQTLTATFDGLVGGETAESLGLVSGGRYNWLDTNYNRNSAYLDANAYDTPAYGDLQTLADLNGVKGYFVVLTDSEVKLNALNGLLKNYDWSFEYGKVIIVAVEGDVRIITVKEYNGEDQKPGAQYKNAAGNWVDLNVVVYEDATYKKIAENAEVKNVDTYYLLLKKFDDESTPLAGAETSGGLIGCVKKEFTITKRQIEIKISDYSVSYGVATRSNYEQYLSWSYANEDPNHKPLSGDELDIVLNLDLKANSFDGGDYLNAGVYGIVAGWNEDMTNYEVRFLGSDGNKGIFEVSLAQISFKEAGEYNQVIEEDGRLTMSLGEMSEDGSAYVNFSFTGFQNTDLVQIYYSNPYNLDKNDPDKFAPDKDETVTETTSPIFYRTGNDSRYFVNFRIEIPNHEPYYGQWKALVLVDTIYIRILFVDGKTYDVVYGDALPDGKTLATELWDKGYIDKLSTGIQSGKFKEYIESGLVTARVVTDNAGEMARGSYSIVFEGFENVEDGKYQVTYKENVTDPDSKATNVGKYVVNRRSLTLTWDETSFTYDGEAHIPTPGIQGWKLLNSEQNGNQTLYTFENEVSGATLNLTVKTNGGDFTSVGGENIVIAEIEDANYALDSFNATRAVSILGESTPLPVDPSDPTPVDPADPVNTIVQDGVSEWIVWVLGIVAVLALFVIFVLAAKSKRPKTINDADGFYDNIDENS